MLDKPPADRVSVSTTSRRVVSRRRPYRVPRGRLRPDAEECDDIGSHSASTETVATSARRGNEPLWETPLFSSQFLFGKQKSCYLDSVVRNACGPSEGLAARQKRGEDFLFGITVTH
jgi:hypothetical protein